MSDYTTSDFWRDNSNDKSDRVGPVKQTLVGESQAQLDSNRGLSQGHPERHTSRASPAVL